MVQILKQLLEARNFDYSSSGELQKVKIVDTKTNEEVATF